MSNQNMAESAFHTDEHLAGVQTRWQHEYQLKRLSSVRSELASIRPRLRYSGGGKEVESALRALDKAIHKYPPYSEVRARVGVRCD